MFSLEGEKWNKIGEWQDEIMNYICNVLLTNISKTGKYGKCSRMFIVIFYN